MLAACGCFLISPVSACLLYATVHPKRMPPFKPSFLIFVSQNLVHPTQLSPYFCLYISILFWFASSFALILNFFLDSEMISNDNAWKQHESAGSRLMTDSRIHCGCVLMSSKLFGFGMVNGFLCQCDICRILVDGVHGCVSECFL